MFIALSIGHIRNSYLKNDSAFRLFTLLLTFLIYLLKAFSMRRVIFQPVFFGLLFILFVGFEYLPDRQFIHPDNLFESDELLRVKISGDIRTLIRDRGDDPQYLPMTISELDNPALGSYIFKVKTRGHFRLQLGQCKYPPILLNFAKRSTPNGSVFLGQDKLKLVVPCRNEQDLFKEHLLYKIYNELTEYSFRVRMAEIHFFDTQKNKLHDITYGFILEDQDLMAERLQGKIFKRNGLRDKSMNKKAYLMMTVFEYFIGNTDWSIKYRHNIKLLTIPGIKLPVPVPYDFDHAGFVSAAYAKPPAELELNSVRERMYRGYCMENDWGKIENALAIYQEKQSIIYRIIQDDPWLDARTKKNVTDFVNDFYSLLEKPRAVKREFLYPCLPQSKADVIIKGLRT